MSLAVLLLLLPAAAMADPAMLPHTVVAGETLAGIAHRFGANVDLMRAANTGVDGEHLLPGQVVLVPPPPAGWPHHRVMHGETLFAVSRAAGVPVADLMALNGLTRKQLEVDQDLLVPQPIPAIVASAPPPVPHLALPSPSHLALPPPPPVPGDDEDSASNALTSAPMAPPPAATPTPAATPSPLPAWVPVTLPDGRKGWAPASSMLVPAPVPLPPSGVLDIAKRLFGVPYIWGGGSPNGADCSGFVQEVFRLAGYALPRTADVQYTATVEVPKNAAKPGDLVFFSTYAPGPSHVGIYEGDGRFIHASSSQGVTESTLSETYYAKHFLAIHRIKAWVQGQ
ncbi:MAG: C40 family peptidase [Candidatus Xenobia bacterium]